MKKYIMLVVLLAAGAAVATPMPSREKPNALGFHHHQPKSSLHNSNGAPVVADTSADARRDLDRYSAAWTGPDRAYGQDAGFAARTLRDAAYGRP